MPKGKKELVRPVKFDILKALDLRSRGLSYEKIGKVLGINRNSIASGIGKLGDLLDNTNNRLTAYREHEADILDAVRSRMIDALYLKLEDPEEAKKIDIQRLIWGFGVLFDKSRLFRGQSTANLQQLTTIITNAHMKKSEAKDRVGPITPYDKHVPEDAEIVEDNEGVGG